MEKRLTWEEIVKQYPEQWVGLMDVEWEDGDIKTAIVLYSHLTKKQALNMEYVSNGEILAETTYDQGMFVGLIG